MRRLQTVLTLACALLVPLAAAGTLAAAEPELISATPFEVRVSGGTVEVNFTLALSEVTTYPVTITAIAGSTEELLYQGTLSEGVYRLSAPLTKISGSGDLRVVLKTKVTNRSDKGNETYYVYLKWAGTR